MLEEFSMKHVTQLYIIVPLLKRSSKCTLVPCDYANTAELVVIILLL